MGRFYYGQNRRREASIYNDKGKLLKISYCDTLDLKDLEKQKKIYLAELDEINKIFNNSEGRKKKEQCDLSLKKLRPLLKELLEESKIVSDKSFYNEKIIYFEEKKLFKKNKVDAHIKLYAKDETKGDKFLKIARSIADECDKINDYSNFNSKQYKMNDFLRELGIKNYHHEQSEIPQMLNDDFNNDDMKILNIYNGRYYHDGHYHSESGIKDIDERYSRFFLNSMGEPYKGYESDIWQKHRVNNMPSEPITYRTYFNQSDFMKKFLNIIQRFPLKNVPPHNPDNQKRAIEAIEKFLRKIELATRAKKKGKEKMENVGYVYVLSNESLPPNTYKIGSTYGLPEERAEDLTGTGHITPFKVVGKIKVQSAEYYEKSIHKILKDYRVKKEFFKLDLKKIKDCLKQVSELSDKGEQKLTLSDLKKRIKI